MIEYNEMKSIIFKISKDLSSLDENSFNTILSFCKNTLFAETYWVNQIENDNYKSILSLTLYKISGDKAGPKEEKDAVGYFKKAFNNNAIDYLRSNNINNKFALKLNKTLDDRNSLVFKKKGMCNKTSFYKDWWGDKEWLNEKTPREDFFDFYNPSNSFISYYKFNSIRYEKKIDKPIFLMKYSQYIINTHNKYCIFHYLLDCIAPQLEVATIFHPNPSNQNKDDLDPLLKFGEKDASFANVVFTSELSSELSMVEHDSSLICKNVIDKFVYILWFKNAELKTTSEKSEEFKKSFGKVFPSFEPISESLVKNTRIKICKRFIKYGENRTGYIKTFVAFLENYFQKHGIDKNYWKI